MFHRLIAVALVLFCAFPAFGQFTRDKAANKKIDEAINTHYFATDFDKAEGVLLGTVEACGDKCSPQTLSRAWMYIGIVRGSGKKDIPGAKEAFTTALSLDPNVKLDNDLASAETKTAFAEIGGSGGGATVAPPAGGGEDIGGEAVPEAGAAAAAAGGEVPGGMVCTPDVSEMQTRRPVPVSCSSEAGPASAELRYKAFGETTWTKIPLKKDGEMWEAEIPCAATADAGALRWYVQGRAQTGDVVDNYGTEKQPVVMSVTEDSAADPPAYPGVPAPERCSGMGADSEICPPDFPGCDSGDKSCGDKDWGASCGNSSECKCGLLCVDGACETAPSCESDSDCAVGTCVGGTCAASGDGGDTPSGPYKKMWIGAHFAYDMGTVGGDDVCYSKTQENGNFACFYNGEPYPSTDPARGFDDPTSGRFFTEEPHTGTNIQSGIAPGTMRALLSFDYALSAHFTLGGRAGYALAGNPGDFLPVHAEARASYHFSELGSFFGPYVGLSAGLAQVDMKVSATMYNCSPNTKAQDPTFGMPELAGYNVEPDASGNGYTDGSGAYANVPSGKAYEDCVESSLGGLKEQLPKVPVDVYQKSGPIFVGGHLGGILRFGSEPKNMGVQLNLNIQAMLPAQSLVLEPSLGFIYGL